MQDLKVVGLDLGGKHVLCETVDPAGHSEKYRLVLDDKLRTMVNGDGTRAGQSPGELGGPLLRPKEIQARIRAGASVFQLAESTGVDPSRIERFAHPVLLERARAAELATAAHPMLADGPAMLTLLETVTTALVNRGQNPDTTAWDAWRNEDGRWTVQLSWQAGHSENVAHFRFSPGAHGGVVAPVDAVAHALIDPGSDRPLQRPQLASVAQLEFEASGSVPAAPQLPEPMVTSPETQPIPTVAAGLSGPAAAAAAAVSAKAEPAPTARGSRTKRTRTKPEVPAWEDVLLGVRSSGEH